MVDIVIVNWNSGNYLSKCIDTIFTKSNEEVVGNVVIIDNNSSDESIKKINRYEKIVIVENKQNNGFSKACNQGFKLCTGTHILLLNPDTQLYNNTISDCVAFMNEKKEIDILGCQLLNDNGGISHSCSRFPTPQGIFRDSLGLSKIAPNIFKPGIIMTDWDHKESRYVDQVMGAFMFMRSSIFKIVGYFDEQFFVYYEEVDFSKRLAELGGKSFFNANIKAIHTGEGTTSSVKGFRLFLNLRSRLLYAKKHFNFLGYFSVYICTFFFDPITRSLFLIFSGRSKEISDLWKGYKLLTGLSTTNLETNL